MSSTLKRLALLLLFALPLQAQPWYRDWRVWRMIGTTVASDIARTHEIHECRMRRNAGIAFCNGGYGEFAAREAVVDGGGLLFDGIGIWGRHLGIKEYSMFADGWSINNTRVAWQQAGIGCSAGYEPVYGTKYNCQRVYGGYDVQTKPDLSSIVLVHR